MCGNKGTWEITATYNESKVDGCQETKMCPPPPQQSSDGNLLLQPYTPVDYTGNIMGGTSVYYKYVIKSETANKTKQNPNHSIHSY